MDMTITPAEYGQLGAESFNRFSVALNGPRAPLTEMWPAPTAGGWIPCVGSFNDSTPHLNQWIQKATFTNDDVGKYAQAYVYKSVVTVTATPTFFEEDNVSGLTKYETEALLTCSKSALNASQFYGGTGLPNDFTNASGGPNAQNYGQRPLTRQQQTYAIPGGAHKSARIMTTYKQKRLNSISPLDKFTFHSNTTPVDVEYLHVSLLPLNPNAAKNICPHRVSVHVEYYVKLSSPGSQNNVGQQISSLV